MQLILIIDLAGAAFQDGNAGHESARILHNAAERLVTLQARYGALDFENPEQLYLQDRTGALAGYVSTVQIDEISAAAQTRISAMVRAQVDDQYVGIPVGNEPRH